MSQGIKCGKCKGYHHTIADVKACSLGTAQTSVATINPDPATVPQIRYLNDLVNIKAIPETPEAVAWFDHLSATIAADKLSKREASFAINRLKGFPYRQKWSEAQAEKKARDYATVYSDGMDETEKVLAPKPAPVTEDGMYRNPTTGEIFKVQRAVAQGNGQLYAKQLIVTLGGPAAGPYKEIKAIPLAGELEYPIWEAHFAYAPGAIKKLQADWRMSLEEAKKFGALYGSCIRCGRTLTDEGSIAAGIGPICAGKI